MRKIEEVWRPVRPESRVQQVVSPERVFPISKAWLGIQGECIVGTRRATSGGYAFPKGYLQFVSKYTSYVYELSTEPCSK